MKLKKPYMLIIFGPTAVGKTDIALRIAHQVQGEIINMDVGQFYKPLTIGTAKPDWQSISIPHHLFDIVDKPEHISVAQYREMLLPLLKEIWSRGKLPILVGGSGFYLKSIFFPPAALTIQSSYEHENKNVQELWQELCNVDPERALNIGNKDLYRIKRALAIWYGTGKKPSEYMPVYDPPSPFTLLCLTRDRTQLYERINTRVIEMLHAGWIEETKKLQGTAWESFLKTKKIIGYDDILVYLQSQQSPQDLQQLIHVICKRTRNYAKRQLTFWKMLQKELTTSMNKAPVANSLFSTIESVDLTLSDVDLYIKQLLNNVAHLFT